MTSCGQQSLNVLTVLSLLISAGRTSMGAQQEGEVWGAGNPFPGSVVAHPGFWVLTGGSPSSLPHWHPPGEELWFGAVRPTVCCALHTCPQSSAERFGHVGCTVAASQPWERPLPNSLCYPCKSMSWASHCIHEEIAAWRGNWLACDDTASEGLEFSPRQHDAGASPPNIHQPPRPSP